MVPNEAPRPPLVLPPLPWPPSPPRSETWKELTLESGTVNAPAVNAVHVQVTRPLATLTEAALVQKREVVCASATGAIISAASSVETSVEVMAPQTTMSTTSTKPKREQYAVLRLAMSDRVVGVTAQTTQLSSDALGATAAMEPQATKSDREGGLAQMRSCNGERTSSVES